MSNFEAQRLEEEGKLLGEEPAFNARIYVGCHDTERDFTRPLMEVKSICQEFVNDEGLCVNVQENWYAYGSDGEGGNEHGAVVELIHYPRFPREDPEHSITEQALRLGEILMEHLHQKRVSVVTSTKTYTLQNPDHEDV